MARNRVASSEGIDGQDAPALPGADGQEQAGGAEPQGASMPGGATGISTDEGLAHIPLVSANPIVGSALEANPTIPEGAPPPPKVERFRVVAERPIMTKGGPSKLKAGKIVDSQNYDLKALRRQGVQLVAVGDDEY